MSLPSSLKQLPLLGTTSFQDVIDHGAPVYWSMLHIVFSLTCAMLLLEKEPLGKDPESFGTFRHVVTAWVVAL